MAAQIASDRVVSSSKAVRDFGKLIDKSQEGAYFIFRRNKPEAVLLSIEEYEALQAQRARLEKLQEMLDHVMLYAELQAREREPGEEITLEELEAKYELSREESPDLGHRQTRGRKDLSHGCVQAI